MNQLKGTGVALVTPFHDDQSIDFDGLKKLIDHVIDGGVDYLVVLGTTGETVTLTSAEKKQVLKSCLEYNAGRVPVVYGLGGNNTMSVLNDIAGTNFAGITAILSVSPYYNKPTQAGIIEHYKAIADACPVPVILYNIPGRTMSNITAETTLTLAEHSNIIGMKEASGNLEQCMHIAASMPKGFLLVSGDDLMTKALYSIGGSGIISVMANALPATFKALCHGTEDKSLQAAFSLLPLNNLMYAESNPVGIKNLLYHLGICGDQVRLPMLRASLDLNQKIKAEFQKLK
ncbi:4-hydroxy-tetrahydrodipicolinate synthase [Algoriphagus ratkowskyi]|uniref:4-hydroxy-tetrahydrodipicolinate synthase n=1 Tax=Algoriphagus ratkowskyi TaxID=57028 RepID=A0A2W7R4W4_9BACT|nr:4-hydroxy-tetrahydrodipicolinate synthase [Algoriphagus ratkowskyi]PZX55903.1 4-hydroxy-tetrahydrodipicolinate synthase [Algoriphagus ratkowskyi]TXD77277.1 4-hydroxy-tetrahydrodipicolinate synthase [Algoriphagus ratkowskyi]